MKALEVAERYDSFVAIVNAGKVPNPTGLRMTLAEIRSDFTGPFWNAQDPSHGDVCEVVADLTEMLMTVEGRGDDDDDDARVPWDL